jgi:serine/threonine-protein kinase
MGPQVGQVVNNKYRLLRLIGDGGMGSVYEARHEVLGTSVALKFLHAELAKRAGLVQRFLQEARVSAQIQSPHVVRVTDVDQTGSGAFIVMEYIEGKTLQTLYEELYKAGVQLSYGDALEYSMQMLEGVEAAHRSGIVHRDLKPDNVMITVDGKGRALIKLLDFGIAKLKVSGELDRALTKPGVIMGTPEYMAPEQAFSADAVDARADIFSLGVIIFEMLAGRRPVGGEDPHQIAGAYLTGQISRLTELAPDIAPELADAVHRAMAATASDRWASVAELRDAMEPFALAARAPSVMSSASLSRVSLQGLTPTPSVVRLAIEAASQAADRPGAFRDAGQRAVAKTLPPEAPPASASLQRPSAAAINPDTNPADPPAMSDGARGPTPLGGFGAFAEAAGQAAASGLEGAARSSGEAFGLGDPEGVPQAPPMGPPFVPPTRSVMPLGASIMDPAATALASPLLPSPLAPSPHSPAAERYSSAPLPSGTVLHPELASPYVMEAPPLPASSLSMNQGPAPFLPPPVPSYASKPSAARKPGVLSSLPAILLLAAGVSAAVVGGVYLAHRQSKTDDHEDPPVAAVPSATVTADPPPTADVPVPTVAPPVSRPTHPTGPLKPLPLKGSATPVTPQPPRSAAPRDPFPPILIIPSSLPFDLPFGGPPSQPRNAPPPDQPPPRGRAPQPPARGESPRGDVERMMFSRPPHAQPQSWEGNPVDAAFTVLNVVDQGLRELTYAWPAGPSRWATPPSTRPRAHKPRPRADRFEP